MISLKSHLPERPEYPNNDIDRIDLVLKYMFNKPPRQHHQFERIVKQYYHWPIDQKEMDRLETKLVMTKFVDAYKQQLLQMLHLNDWGREQLGDLSTFRKYIEVTQVAKTAEERKETMRDELTAAQLHLTTIQTKLDSLHLEDYPATKILAENADKTSTKGYKLAVISTVLAALSLLITVVLELLKSNKIWPFSHTS